MKKKRIAVIMKLDPYRRHYDIFAGIQDYAKQHENWHLEIGNYPEQELKDGLHFDGIIGRITQDCYDVAKEANIPMVNTMVDSPLKIKVVSVCTDFEEAGRVMAQHLISRGLKSFAYFGYRQRASQLQYQGMLKVAQEYGYSCRRYTVSNYFEKKTTHWQQFKEQILKILTTWQAPMGMGSMADELSRAITSIAINSGWIIPEQLAIVGSNNNPLVCNSIEPTLSSIDMGQHQCGYQAAKQLSKIIQGKQVAKEVFAPLKGLIVRRTSDVFAVSDSKIEQALRYMADHSNESLSVPIIASATGIGRQSLERRFKKHVGRTVNDELTRLRVATLKRLLVESDKPINILSEEVGFGTPASMYIMFRRETNMTPKEYRQLHNPRKEE